MADYPHLKLPVKVEGVAKPPKGGGGGAPLPRTLENRDKRTQHGQNLSGAAASLLSSWNQEIEQKRADGLEVPNEVDIPVFLEVDTNAFDIESLRNWGIELISEESEGFIIGASFDHLDRFQKNVNQFLNQEGRYANAAAKIWQIAPDNSWRLTHILKGELQQVWDQLQPTQTYIIEIGVSCPLEPMDDSPVRTKFDSEAAYNQAVGEYSAYEQKLWIERNDKQMKRETEIEKYVSFYSGELIDIWDNEVDAIFFKIALPGQGWKDLVINYPFLFDARFSPQYNVETQASEGQWETELDILPPDPAAAKVCVIDSGIQEGHRLLAPAIDSANSRSYVQNDPSTSDLVRQSGHGTKVAGAILYPAQIPSGGHYQLETIIQNARILDRDNKISDQNFSPNLLEQIVADYAPTRIYNLSVTEDCCTTGFHMPPVAAAIDKLMHEKDVLFIVAAGNLYHSNPSHTNPGITEQLATGKTYPDYLNEACSGIACPGTSSFAITVGSIAHADYEDSDYKAMASPNYISPFSRTGLGMWKVIKPDVVEYGGNLIKNKNAPQITVNEEVCPMLVNSTLYGSAAVGVDFGTSFSTPKVSYIAARLQALHPHESAQMYRALIVQSARLPDHCFHNPTHNDIRYYGYGIPNLDRALNNNPKRITFIQNGHLGAKKADIYNVMIPQELRGEAHDYTFLVEVTLAFTAKIRQTRKGAHSYLSTWLDWKSSKYNQEFQSFRNKTIEYLENENTQAGPLEEGEGAIQWCLRENPSWADNGINRNNSTVQKSWALIQAHQFTDSFSLAVVGHAGWDKNTAHEVPYALCVSFEVINTEVNNLYQLMAEAQVVVEAEAEAEAEIAIG